MLLKPEEYAELRNIHFGDVLGRQIIVEEAVKGKTIDHEKGPRFDSYNNNLVIHFTDKTYAVYHIYTDYGDMSIKFYPESLAVTEMAYAKLVDDETLEVYQSDVRSREVALKVEKRRQLYMKLKKEFEGD